MIRWILFTVFSISVFSGIMAQNYVGPSPNSMGIVRLANQVNYFTGSPVIQIPLATLPGKELSASVALAYNSFGHRVQDVASSEGLGWSLVGGGVITRVVRGEPDDLQGGYCKPSPTDTEPDLYTFSVGGMSGKFVLDKNGIPILMPFQDVIIKPGICRSGADGRWEIIDANGVKYYFGVTEYFRETTTYRRTTENPANAKTHISSWLLEKVISPNNTDAVFYTYSSSSFSYENYSYFMDTGTKAINPNVVQNSTFYLTQNVKHLATITTSGGSIQFAYDGNRQDLPGGKHLTGIRVMDHLGVQVSRLSLQYGYFGSGTELCKRLRLEAIRDLGSNPLYTFTYNQSINLPCRDSPSIDYLGLHNNYSGTLWIPPSIENIQTGPRRADAVKMQANLLTRIDMKGGGYTIYEFEPNSAYFPDNSFLPVLSGNRVAKIKSFDGTGSQNQVEYKYERLGMVEGNLTLVTSGQGSRVPFMRLHFDGIVTRYFSHSLADLFDLNGVFVGYLRVVEIVDGKGSTEYIFSGYNSTQLLNTSTPLSLMSTKFWERGLLTSKKTFATGNIPISLESFEYNLSNPNLRTINAEEKIIVPVQNHRDPAVSRSSSYSLISKAITLTQKSLNYYDQNDTTKKVINIEQYGYQAPTYQLASLTAWNSANPNEKVISVTKFITHPDYNLNTTNCESQLTTCLNSCVSGYLPACEGDCYTAYNSCKDQAFNAMQSEGKAIIKMRERHMNNAVVESQQFIQRAGENYLVGATINKYVFSADQVFPQSNWVSRKNSATNYTGSKIKTDGSFEMSPLFVETSNLTYNVSGKMTSQTNRDGIKTDFTYSNNNMTVSSQTVSPASNPITKSYVYKPLVGLTQETDPNGRAVNMEYDGMNRLRLVKDHDNNIRERYRYHAKNETPNFRIVGTSAQIMAGQSVTFSLEDIFIPSGGTSTRHWSTGTGTSYTDNRQTMTHTYTTPGLYMVTATLITNEFSSVTRTFGLLVTGPLQISICANGPQEKDLCNPANRVWGSCTAAQVDYGYTRFQASFSPATSTGCTGIYNYHFEYRLGGGSWTTFSNGPQNYGDYPHNPNAPGYYYIRCTITDSCNNTSVASSYVNIYKSNPNCTPINY